MPATPSSVAMAMARSEPITTTNTMACSDSPNHRSASGSQQMEGSAWSPSTSGFTVECINRERALAMPSATPMSAEMR